MKRILSMSVVILSLLIGAPTQFAQSISTGIASPDDFVEGCMFDINASKNITVQSFDLQLMIHPIFPSTLVELEIWTTIDGGSYLGREEDPHAWRRIGLLNSVVPLGTGSWTPLSLDLNESILSGQSRGFYIVRPEQNSFGGLFAYASAVQGTTFVSNSDLAVIAGADCHYFDRFTGAAMVSMNVLYDVDPVLNHNVRLNGILSPGVDPTSCLGLGSSESLAIEILSLGTNSILPGTVIPVSYQIDGGPSVQDFAVTSTTLNQNDSFIHTFSQPLDLSSIGNHVIDVSINWLLDQEPLDDSSSLSVASGGDVRVTEYPWFETFDSLHPANVIVPPLGWSQDPNDATGPDSEWHFSNVGGPGTRPDEDHTTGVSGDGSFAYADDEHSYPTVILRSPCFDLSNLSHPELRFWMFSRNVNVSPNWLSVDVLDVQSGLLTMDVFGPVGHLSDLFWIEQVVDLSAFSGQQIQLFFRATTDHGGSTQDGHDIAIDDVSMHNVAPTIGQAPQPGIAVLNLHGSRNINNEAIESGLKGPYFSSVPANTQMLIEFSGEPQMPVLLLAGPLNPLAANFPFIGNMDIGGPVDPISGIPSGVVVLADGNLPTGLHPFFHTGPSGDGMFGVTVPNVPPGILTTFQCAVYTSGANGSYIALSNAVQVEIQ